MLPKSKRLSTKLVTSVMGKGQSFHSPFFVIRLAAGNEKSSFSISVPKKIAKTAVQRNKIRRQAYSAIKTMESGVKGGFNAVVIAKSGLENLSFDEVKSELEKIFVKSGLLK